MPSRRSVDLDAGPVYVPRKRKRTRRPKLLPRRLVVGPLVVLEIMRRQGLIVEPEEWKRLPKGMPAKAYSESKEDE